MKKIIACISLVFAMSAGVTALAADTATPGDNTDVTVNTDATYNTVLITEKVDTSKIVYVDQNDSGFATATNFLLKEGTGEGDYTVKMGSASGAATSFDFTIGSATPDLAMAEAYTYHVGDKKDMGFTLEDELDGYSKLVFTATDGEKTGTATIDLPTSLTGGSTVKLAVRVTRIPQNITLSLGVSAATTETE